MSTTTFQNSTGFPWRLLGMWALLLPGVIVSQQTFGGLWGYVPGLAGITVGAAIAWAGVKWRWSPAIWFGALLGSYLILGGAVALPRTTIAGVIPTLDTIRRLVLLTFQGWRDLLTVATPAGDITGPAAVPWLAGLLFGAMAGAAVLLRRAYLWPMVFPVLWLGGNIAFGVRAAPTSLWLGAALGVGLLVWVVAHRLLRQQNDNSRVLVADKANTGRLIRRVGAAVLVIAVAAGASVGIATATSEDINRQVLRDNVAPPLDLQNYPSPLAKYRLYELDQKDEVLFTVENMPADSRLRLAVMDTYDGNVFNVSQDSARYLRTGRELPPTEGEQASVSITTSVYNDVWVPTFGVPTWIEFTDDNAGQEADGLFYNDSATQALTTASLSEGSSLSLDAVIVPELTADERAKLEDAGAGQAEMATAEKVPDILVQNATDWTGDAESAYQQLTMLSERLIEEGYYSDGSDNKSRSGHTSERLATMFTANQLIGDDEQYATSMALMASQLGIPVRVVLGFYPADDEDAPESWEVTGTQAHVWVEANLDGAGWVTFDSTPDRDKTPQTDVPQPKPKPKPQIDPPPNPPERLPDEPLVADEDAARNEEDQLPFDWLALLGLIGVIAGGLFVVAAPILAILGYKARRARIRRSNGTPVDQLAGAWDEVVDQARDVGQTAATSNTRQEEAALLQQQFPQAGITGFASSVDAHIFSSPEVAPEVSKQAWDGVGDLKYAMLATLPAPRRILARLSLRSIRRPKVAPKPPTEGAPAKKSRFPRLGRRNKATGETPPLTGAESS